ncbi:MAG: hypothetical protein ACR2GN_05270 [Bacteroidia bacterium]
MPRSIYILTFILLLVLSFYSKAQTGSNLRSKNISVVQDTVLLDTLTIVPGSFYLINESNEIIDTSAYKVDLASAQLVWIKNNEAFINLNADSVKVYYRVFPFDLAGIVKYRDRTTVITESGTEIIPYTPSTTSGGISDLFSFEGLNKSGSISRGVTVGNNQDVVVNSSLNLQLSGKLSENIDLVAAISDENIPIQPEGNTQQLQDFDKVFIQLSDKRNKLIAGDYELSRPAGYFMNFYKKAQGLSFNTINPLRKVPEGELAPVLKSNVSLAFSKGKFARNQINGIEANQGPYKLTGANNELFIIILSGTEKVFVDGLLVERGLDRHYVIDYNLAEIIFTPRLLITKDSRIVVEFEYSERNYARSLYFINNEYENKKLKIRANIYSEQDNKNQPAQQNLDDDKKFILSQIGDSLQYAFVPNVDSVPYTPNQVLYSRKDTTTSSGLTYSVYVYSTNPDSAYYRVGFSFVGQGNGDYVLANSTVNGRVYRWVEPISGISQGSFRPEVLLVTPKKQQLFILGSDYIISKNTFITAEGAMSNNDLNLFSTINDNNNQGFGYKTKINDIRSLSGDLKSGKGWKINSSVEVEQTDINFQPIERYRHVEFERDWNIFDRTTPAGELIAGAGIGLSNKDYGQLNYGYRTFHRSEIYRGDMHSAGGVFNRNNYNIAADASYLWTRGGFINTQFIRHRADVSKGMKWFRPGFKEQGEHNNIYSGDSLIPASFQFTEWQAYILNADTSINKFKIDYTQRNDYRARSGEFNHISVAHTAGLGTQFLKNKYQKLTTQTTYRELLIKDTVLTADEAGSSLLNRIEYSLNALKGGVNASTFYEISTGQEQKKEFVYVEVASGTGVYTWTDYNNNGVQELTEFEIAPFPDLANYIRVFTPTNEYVKTLSNQFNQVLQLSPLAFAQKKEGFTGFIARFSTQSQLRLEKKTLDLNDLGKALNPFLQEIADTTIVTTNSVIRNSLFFNRSSQIFGADITWQQNQNKSFLTNGFELRKSEFYLLNTRWNITKEIGLLNSAERGYKLTSSEFFSLRNYNINYYSDEPKVTYQPGVAFRVSLAYKYTLKENEPEYGNELSEQHRLSTEIRYSTVKAGSLTARASLIRILYNDVINTPIAFEILEGFRPGDNVTWGLSLQRSISSNMQLNVNYDGRKSEEIKPIHTGGVEIRAFF